MYVKSKQNGFTLVELSIVLVIIGLIVGGVVGGQSLIHAAKIQKTLKTAHSLKVAIRAYELQYDAFPGDHVDAYDYFDGSGGDEICGTNDTHYGTGCNGNGNRKIAFSDSEEPLAAFRHLTLAKILPGNYRGRAQIAKVGTHAPSTEFSKNTFFTLDYESSYQSDTQSGIKNRIVLQGNGNPSYYGKYAALTPKDAATLDKKGDDGKADQGWIRASEGIGISRYDCHDRYTPYPYSVSLTGAKCVISFEIGN
jgi:prepilin-type N-terminal cleavage/methylation domain-containing protein